MSTLCNRTSRTPATPEALFAAIGNYPSKDLVKKLTSLPLSKSVEVLQWFMVQFEHAGEGLMDFAKDIHLMFDQLLKKHNQIAQIMASSDYSHAIGGPAKMAWSNLRDKLRQDKKIRAVWGENWAQVAKKCMLKILLWSMTDFAQILVPIQWQ